MKYTSIRIEGSILSPDILERIDAGEVLGQSLKDFHLSDRHKNLKEYINVSWAKSLSQWEIFKNEISELSENDTGTTITRKHWILPMLGFLGYKNLEFSRSSEKIANENEKQRSYPISHREESRDNFPVHIIGFRESLDKKIEGRYSMSPHSMMQEYLNVTEHLYALVTNGKTLRVLRDNSRLVKLSFIEFDLEKMFEEKNFTDFALMFRLIHLSRMPVKQELSNESLIEKYHLDSLELGSTIRKGLSECVKDSIEIFSKGFLKHPDNNILRDEIANGYLKEDKFYNDLLRLIYRILFLIVIEERNLVYPANCDKRKKELYYKFYSIVKIRDLSSKKHIYNINYKDLWLSVLNTFKLYESELYGNFLDIKPLSGSLFSKDGIGYFSECSIDNDSLLRCFEKLGYFYNENIKQKIKINYASLNVEEFGSVYESLLDFETKFFISDEIDFKLVKSDARSSSGSHYTPDELVQPLIKNSLDHIIEEKLKESNQESKAKALLSIKVCDVACGSGHILLSASRRIALELAKVRTGEDFPSPAPYREAIREVIINCIYGVDKNPLAVELCKVALWLEAHNPGEPLNFLDHHIKCGDAIVGLAHKEELENGIADEAFKKLAGDDGEITKKLSKNNREQRKKRDRLKEYFQGVYKNYDNFMTKFHNFEKLPENNPEEILFKQNEYFKLINDPEIVRLRDLANIQTAQFFIPKTVENEVSLVTDAEYLSYTMGANIPERVKFGAEAVSIDKKFFHWFLEFPEVFVKGGFDCILGNPPFLGGNKISTNYGNEYLEYLKFNYFPAGGTSDYVTYFLRRIFNVTKEKGFLAIITTNTIAQGDTREGGLDIIVKNNGNINFAVKSMPWTGLATVSVSLLSIFKGNWFKNFILDAKHTEYINSYLTNEKNLIKVVKLKTNKSKSFIGSYPLGDGFILTKEEATNLIELNPKNKAIIFPYINGRDLNSNYDQSPSRWIINFFDWSEEKCKNEYPECYKILEEKVKAERALNKRKERRERWWQYAEKSPNLYLTIKSMASVICKTRHSPNCAFEYVNTNVVFQEAIVIFSNNFKYFFSIMSSTIHEMWAWNYGSTLGESTLRYSPSDCFETFPFPVYSPQPSLNHREGVNSVSGSSISDFSLFTSHLALLEEVGKTYHDFRKDLMYKMKLGLTDTYNLFHKKDLSVDDVIKTSKQEQSICESAFKDISVLRELHKKMDNEVLKTYGWTDIDLAHDFYEVEYLPEKDRVRYTISPESRKEILKRLLLLNHQIHEMEERGEKVISAINFDEINNDNNDSSQGLRTPKNLSLFDEPEQLELF